MDKRRLKPSEEQKDYLLDYMERNLDFAHDR